MDEGNFKTREEIAADYEAKKKFKVRDPSKIINAAYFRDVCHANGVKLSEEGLKEFANMNRRILQTVINDTKEMGFKVVLRRHVERHVIG